MSSRRIEYVPLGDVRPNERNPKDHDLATINASVGRFGYIEPIVRDERTNKLISGHGRLETLAAMEDQGEEAPDGIDTDPETGGWLVPIAVGWSSRTDTEAEAALIALNRTTELGGWENATLLTLLNELGDDLEGVGFTQEDRDELEKLVAGGDDDDREYSRKTDVPHYQPTQEEPPEESELVDTTKTKVLIEQIKAEGVPDEVERFLILGAYRHLVFDYSQIAEYYAHAPARTQYLMEKSAMVIIDLDDAIKNGYTTMSDGLDELQAEAARGPEDELGSA